MAGQTPKSRELGDQPYPLDWEHWEIVLKAGLKPVFRSSNVVEQDLPALLEWVEENGLHARQGWSKYDLNEEGLYDFRENRGALGYVFISAQASLVDEIWEADREEKESERDASTATRTIGRLLGYPRCCVEHHTAGTEPPSADAFFYRTWRNTAGAPHPYLNPTCRLLGHIPCSFDCKASVEAHKAIIARVREVDSARAEALQRHLTKPLLFVSVENTYRFDGQWRDGCLQYSKVVCGARANDERAAKLASLLTDSEALQLSGRRLRLRRGTEWQPWMDLGAESLEPMLFPWNDEPLNNKPLQIAVLDLQRNRVDFQSVLDLQLSIGDLQSLGYGAQLYQAVIGTHGELHGEEQRERIVRRLVADGTDIAVLSTHVSAHMSELLRENGIRTVLWAGDSGLAQAQHYDAVSAHPDRLSLVDLVAGWERPEKVAASSDVPGGRRTVDPRADAFFFPVRTYVDLESGEAKPFSRFHLSSNVGCPYGADARDNPAYAGVDLSAPELRTKGCAFCPKGGDYKRLSVPDYHDLLVRQIRYFAKGRQTTEIVLIDEASFDNLHTLLTKMEEQALGNVTLLLKARMEVLLSRGEKLRKGLELAKFNGVQIVCYLLGIENFSDRELARFNKGLTREQIVAGLDLLEALSGEFPETFSYKRYPSHRFILFTPWTRWDDLLINHEYFSHYRFENIAAKAPYSRLRMHRWQPLSVLADRDGLLCKADDERLFRKQLRYSDDELPWKFENADVELCWRLVSTTIETLPDAQRGAFKVLEEAIAFVEERRDAVESLLGSSTWPEVSRQFRSRVEAHLRARRAEKEPVIESPSVGQPPVGAIDAMSAELQRMFSTSKTAPWRFLRCRWARTGYAVEVEEPAGGALTVLFEPRDDDAPAYARAGSWNVSHIQPKRHVSKRQVELIAALSKWLVRRGDAWVLDSHAEANNSASETG